MDEGCRRRTQLPRDIDDEFYVVHFKKLGGFVLRRARGRHDAVVTSAGSTNEKKVTHDVACVDQVAADVFQWAFDTRQHLQRVEARFKGLKQVSSRGVALKQRSTCVSGCRFGGYKLG